MQSIDEAVIGDDQYRHMTETAYLGAPRSDVDERLDIRGVRVTGTGHLDLYGVDLDRVYAWSAEASALSLNDTSIDEGVYLRSSSFDHVDARRSEMSSLDLVRAQVDDLDLRDASIGSLQLEEGEYGMVDLRGADIDTLQVDDSIETIRHDGSTSIATVDAESPIEDVLELSEIEYDVLAGSCSSYTDAQVAGVKGSLTRKGLVDPVADDRVLTAAGQEVQDYLADDI